MRCSSGRSPAGTEIRSEKRSFTPRSWRTVTLVCRKLYAQEMDLAAMPEEIVSRHYANGDMHTMYIGEVLRVIKED